MSDELPPSFLEEDDNINLSWAPMDAHDIQQGNFYNQVFQVSGTTTNGLPGQLNGYYGLIKAFRNTSKGGYFIVDVPQLDDDICMPVAKVLVQQNRCIKGSLMLPDGRYLRNSNKL